MKPFMRLSLLALILLGLCTACGGKSSSSGTAAPGLIRLVNATSVNNLSMSATGVVQASGVASGGASSYASLAVGTYGIFAGTADASLAASATQNLTIATGISYTVFAYQRNGAVNIRILTDNQTAPSTGFALLTIGNTGPDAGALDVYVVSPGSSLSGLSPTFSTTASGSTSLTQAIAAGTYDIVVTGSGAPADIRQVLSSIQLSNLEIAYLELTSSSGGTLVNSALVQQGGAVTILPATTARVRVVAAIPGVGSINSNIATSVAGSPLGSLTSPATGTYRVIAANSAVTSIDVTTNGVDVPVTSLPTGTFASGGDYTILVYGTAAAPVVALLTDNNQAPVSAKVRLVNAAVPVGGISLTDNFQSLISDLPYGVASDYQGISGGSSALSVTSPLVSFPTYNLTTNILSGGTYSLFVLGTTTAPIVVFNRDR
jgi:hypothetical protein